MSQKNESVRLRVVQSLFEAERVQALLEQAGIECLVVSYHDTAMDGLYQASQGWGEVRVPGARQEEAAVILEESLAQATNVEDAELERQATEAKEPPAPGKANDRDSGNRAAFYLLALALVAIAATALYLLFSS